MLCHPARFPVTIPIKEPVAAAPCYNLLNILFRIEVVLMKLKKANASLGLLSIAILLTHAVYEVVTYILFIYDPVTVKILGWACAGIVALHAVLGMCIVMFSHDGSALKQYPKANLRTILQRASAIAILVLVVLHILSHNMLQSGTAGLIGAEVVQFLFFTCVFIHIATSFSSAFVTLGWLQNMETKKRIDLAVWIICGILWAVAVFVVAKTMVSLAAMPE